MNLHAFLDELTKIADPQPPSPSRPLALNAVAPKGPSLPKPGGLAMPKLAEEHKKPARLELVAKVKEKIEPKKVAGLKPGLLRDMAKHLHKNEDMHEIAGLASLALPSVDSLQARLRTRDGESSSKKQFLPGAAHDAMEIGGLGYLAAPIVAKKALGKRH